LAEEQTTAPMPRQQQPAMTFGVGFVIGAVIVLALLSATGMLEGCGQRPVAKVGGTTITETALRAELDKSSGEQVLARLVQKTLLEEGFKKSGLKVTPQEVDDRFKQMVTQMGGQEMFTQRMAQDGTSEEQVRQLVQQTLMIEKLKAQLGKVTYTPKDLQDFFNKNKRSFGRPPMVSFQAAVVASREDAERVRGLALKPGASFSDLSTQYSIDPEIRQRHGELEVSVPDLETNSPTTVAELDKLQPGQVSEPFKWQGGPNWAIIKLVRRTAEVVPKFEDVRAQVEQVYKNQKLPSDQELLADLQRKIKVRILKPEYAQLAKFFMQPETATTPGVTPPAGTPTQPGGAPATGAPGGAGLKVAPPPEAGAKAAPGPAGAK